jgi:hypothetical protein
MTPEEKPIDAVICRFLDGEPEPDDGPALAAAMTDDSQFAREVRRLLTIDGLLHQAADADPDAFAESVRTSLAAEDDGADFTQTVSDRLQAMAAAPRARRRRWPWVLGGVAVVAILALAWLANPAPPPPPELPVAFMINEANARFADKAAPDGGNFLPGGYQLQTGTVHVRFTSGAEIVVRSPARFTVIDRMNIALTEGALRAIVPSSAHGFAVHAADVRYVDLGTEFGVSVGGGESRLHVFEGRVDVKNRHGTLLSSFEEGASVRAVGAKLEYTDLEPLEEFPSATTIGLEKWRGWSASLKKDPSLLCYFPFMAEPANPAVLKDHSASQPAWDGRIEGARWVTGRWPGKQALLFDRDGDHVKVAVPGEYRQWTLSAWIYLDRFDFALNAIFNSDGWQTGDFHCQLSRSGELYCGHWTPGNLRRKQLGPRVPVGRWTHVAGVVDLDGLTRHAYINGEPAEFAKLPKSAGLLKPGSSRIGDWLRHPEFTATPNRGFRGRIDEIAVWRRALTQAEIREMVVAGRSCVAPAD